MIKELSFADLDTVSGGFSVGSCSIGGSSSHSIGRHGETTTSGSFHAGCGVNAPDSNEGRGNSGRGRGNSRGTSAHSNNGGGGGHGR